MNMGVGNGMANKKARGMVPPQMPMMMNPMGMMNPMMAGMMGTMPGMTPFGMMGMPGMNPNAAAMAAGYGNDWDEDQEDAQPKASQAASAGQSAGHDAVDDEDDMAAAALRGLAESRASLFKPGAASDRITSPAAVIRALPKD